MIRASQGVLYEQKKLIIQFSFSHALKDFSAKVGTKHQKETPLEKAFQRWPCDSTSIT